MAERQAVLIVNTRSRRGQKWFSAAERKLRDHGWRLAAAHAVRDPTRIPELVAATIAAGHRFVIVGGGDGTLSAAVGAAADRDVVLGVLPLGTANSFALALGLRADLEHAVEVLLTGKIVDIDLGRLDGRPFANAVAIGLPADIASGTPHSVKRWLGRSAYLVLAALRLVRHRPFRCTLTHDGTTVMFEALDVRIANGAYQGGVRVVPEADVESRDLVVRVIAGRSVWPLIETWLRAAFGRPPRAAHIQIVRGQNLTLATDPPRSVSIDGEVVAQTPVRARVAPQALLVMVPRDRTDLD